LPSVPRASDTQLGLIALYYPLLGGLAWWQGKTIYRWLLSSLRGGSSQAKTPKPQSLYSSSRYQAPSGTYQDPIAIGGGREKNNGLFWFLVIEGAVCTYCWLIGGSLWVHSVSNHDRNSALITFFIVLALGIGLILSGFVIRPYGKRRECLKIGSEGIAHYSVEKGNVFIPWDEMSRAYVDAHYFFRYLYIVLADDSNLFYEKPIKLRYESNIGATGAVMICQVSNSSSAVIHEHLVERALRRYAPPRVR